MSSGADATFTWSAGSRQGAGYWRGDVAHPRFAVQVFEYMDHDLTGLLDSGLCVLTAQQTRTFMRQLMQVGDL